MAHVTTKKILLILVLVGVLGVVGYVGLGVYDDVARGIIEEKIKAAGLNPDDYDLGGVAPWNIRQFVTDREIEKAGLDPDNFDIRGTLTADEVRREATKQEIARQLAEYDLTIDDIDLSGVDLLKLSAEEIKNLIYEKVREKIQAQSL